MRRAAGVVALIIAGCGDSGSKSGEDVVSGDTSVAPDTGTTDDTVASADIFDDTVASADIGDDAVAPADIADDAVAPADIADDAVAPADIADDAIAPADIADDAGPTDTTTVDTFEPDPACEYIDMVRFVVKCKGLWVYGGEYMHIGEPNDACIPWVGVNGGSYLTLAEGLEAQQCDPTCVNPATMSASAVYCRADCQTLQRYGWIEYRSEGCPTLYELPGGLFLSVADWFAGNPDVCADSATACLEEPEIPEEP
jgi:hypothetical protein